AELIRFHHQPGRLVEKFLAVTEELGGSAFLRIDRLTGALTPEQLKTVLPRLLVDIYDRAVPTLRWGITPQRPFYFYVMTETQDSVWAALHEALGLAEERSEAYGDWPFFRIDGAAIERLRAVAERAGGPLKLEPGIEKLGRDLIWPFDF